jgi:hypothetical protein
LVVQLQVLKPAVQSIQSLVVQLVQLQVLKLQQWEAQLFDLVVQSLVPMAVWGLLLVLVWLTRVLVLFHLV